MLTYYSNVIQLKNGIWIAHNKNVYDLWYNEKLILASCSNFSYISGKFLAIKNHEKVIIFSMKINNEKKYEPIEKLAEFSFYSKDIYCKITYEESIYLIDKNCQIKFSDKAPIN